MTEAIQSAQDALAKAQKAVSEALSAKYAAVQAVEAEHAPVVRAAQSAVCAAQTALKEAQSAASPDHEWEGKTVYRVDRKYDRWSSARFTDKKLVGTVFTYRPGMDLGPGNNGGYHTVGATWVRLHKKDGKPGARCERLKGRWGTDETIRWALTEEAALALVGK